MLWTILHDAIQLKVLSGKISSEDFKRKLAYCPSVVPDSVSMAETTLFMLYEDVHRSSLIVLSRHEKALSGFFGESMSEQKDGVSFYALVCPLDHGNACCLRKILPHTAPSVLESRQSFGCGDRIGSPSPATPWHIEACSRYGMTPVLAQQSVRENHKTGRTFEQVIDDVTWSVFRSGYRSSWGADADHLKTLDAIDDAVHAGFTMFTLDPSDMIDRDADTDSDETLANKLNGLFPGGKEVDTFISRYEGCDGADTRSVVRSGVKYLPAVRHAVDAYRLLVDLLGESRFNFELSIDETITPTTALDHRIIASELVREGVHLFSLAPRFEGRFEKGIDYIGSLDGFRCSLEKHVALSRELGDYRLSLHSGSDKFSIYPAFGELTDGFFHVKTAGTSYLEAVKVAAGADIELFRRILSLSIETFHENAASYDISANVDVVPDPSQLSGEEALELITSNPDVRQVLHIAFGAILGTLGDEFMSLLREHREIYSDNIVTHIGKHLSLLTGQL